MTYSNLLSQALKSGFEIYCNTWDNNGVPGTILTNTKRGGPYDGEVLDIFENGTFEHYSQFKSGSLNFKFKQQ